MADSKPPRPISVLFVCLGNICRSTMAEGVFQSLTRGPGKSHPLISNIDSCGTGAYHTGDGPDSRTMATLKKNGITAYRHAARKFSRSDFQDFDYILAMDDDNLEDILRLRQQEVQKQGSEDGIGHVCLFGRFGGSKRKSGKDEQIHDPYYGGSDGFDAAYEQSVKFSNAFIEQLEAGELG